MRNQFFVMLSSQNQIVVPSSFIFALVYKQDYKYMYIFNAIVSVADPEGSVEDVCPPLFSPKICKHVNFCCEINQTQIKRHKKCSPISPPLTTNPGSAPESDEFE